MGAVLARLGSNGRGRELEGGGGGVRGRREQSRRACTGVACVYAEWDYVGELVEGVGKWCECAECIQGVICST